MSNCTIFTENFFQSVTNIDDFDIDIGWLESLIPKFSADNSGLWMPIVVNTQQSDTSYGKLLGPTYNIDDYSIPPCECSNVGERIARNTLDKFRLFGTYYNPDEPEDGIFCSYCDSLPQPENTPDNECIVGIKYRPRNELGTPNDNLFWNPNDNTPTVFTNVPCCEGGCDTRALTDDLSPKIPFLYSSYYTKFVDFKYHKQFPAITNPGLGKEKFASYNGSFKDIIVNNMTLCIDWTLEPRIGEIQPSNDTDTYHINLYSHKKSYKNYLTTSKTCGNFLLTKPNASEEGSISDWQVNNYPDLSGLFLNSGVNDVFFHTSDVIPSIDQFSIPYGIKDKTHWNILLSPKTGKVGGLWKWNFSSGIIGWYRYYDIDKKNDERLIQGVDLYIGEGDVFFASNDGPEPLAVYGAVGPCKPKTCPSGLKLNDYTVLNNTSTMTIVPSGSEFIYISSNIYDKVYDYMDRLIKFNVNSEYFINQNKKYKDLLYEAAILASGPQYDNITVDLFSYPSQYSTSAIKEFVDLVNNHDNKTVDNPQISENMVIQDLNSIDRRDSFGRDLSTLKNILNKDMNSYNNINLIKTKKDLINTLVHKYGAYLWVDKKTNAFVEIQEKTLPHIYFDINFEPVVQKRDTFCFTSANPRALTCTSILRGNTKIFGYDQKFTISNASLYSKILEDTLVYNTVCEGDPPASKKNVVSSIMSVYANEERIFAQSIGNYETNFTNIYSRFPSVSSTLDDTFQGIDLVTDEWEDEGVYSLKNDAQFRFNRSYKALAAHGCIDLVGFHEDGGFFYDSTILNKYPGTGTVAFIKNYSHRKYKSKPKIEFNTYDVGIKLYDITISKLRNPDNLSCKTLPLDQSCKCWGLDVVENFLYKCNDSSVEIKSPELYTPFLSTASNPITSYGGFSSEKVQDLLGDFRLPQHPEPGSQLTLTKKVIDINKIFGCTETAEITLSTFVNVDWQLTLPDWDMSNSNLWIHISDPDVVSSRNGVKAIINGGTQVSPNTQVNLGNDLGRNITLKLVNILLDTALNKDDNSPRLYHPNLFTCSKNAISYYDEPSVIEKVKFVTITFGKVPFETKTVFSLPGINSLGTLQETSFDPNKGIDHTNMSRGSCLILDNEGFFNFDYGQRLFNNKSELTTNTSHRILTGTVSKEDASNFNRYINLLNHSRKIRLYFKIGSLWYEYFDHRSFGYYNTEEKRQYYGWPSIFTEHHLTHVEQMSGPFIPAIPKVPLEYIGFINDQSWQYMVTSNRHKYPYSNLFFARDPDDNKKIIIEGSRAYFRFGGESNLLNEDLIPYLTDSYQPFIVQSQNVDSHPIQTIEAAKIKSTNVDSKRLADPYNIDYTQPNAVIKKSVGVNLLPFYSGSSINRNINSNIYNNIYTILELSQPVPYRYGYIVANKDYENSLNFTAFATVEAQNQTLLKSLILPNKFNIADSFSSKWSDIHYYSSLDVLNNPIIKESLNQVYAPSMYDNTLSQLISNNLLFSRFDIDNNGSAINRYMSHWLWLNNSGTFLLDINLDNINTEYYIHRPFSLDAYFDNRYNRSLSRFNLFKNENGVIDINLSSDQSLYNNIGTDDIELFKNSLWDDKGKGNTGLLCFSGIYRPSYKTPPTGLSTTGTSLFIDLDNRFLLKPVPVVGDLVYSDTFVINDTYNVYAGMKLTTEFNDNLPTDCTNIIVPNVTSPGLSTSTTAFNWSRFEKNTTYSKPYASYEIWCDRDIGKKCNPVEPTLTEIGSIKVQSKFYNYAYKYKTIDDLPESPEFAISIDAGLYGGLGFTKNIPYITRAIFTDYSPLAPNLTLLGTSTCVEGASYPPIEKTLGAWDSIFQNEISSNIADSLDIDVWANEIIFRAIYGAKESLEYNDISKYGSSKYINNDKILEYLILNPDNNIQFLYDNIPMDYDRGSTANNLSVDGAIQIYGIARVGDVVNFYYNNELFQIKITEDDKGVFSECPQIGAKGLLYDKVIYSNYFYLREAGSNTSMVPPEDTVSTETIVGYCSQAGSTSVGGGCECGGESHKQPVLPNCEPDYCERGCVLSANVWNPNPRTNGWPGCSNTQPCSAWPIKDINSAEHSSPVDQGFTRYAVTTVLGGLAASESLGLECGDWSLRLGAGSNCCQENEGDFAIQPLTYTVNSCHYTFTFRAMIENSLINTASLSCVSADPLGDCAEASSQGFTSNGPFPTYCDCIAEGFDEYPYLDQNKFFEECGFNLPYDAPSFLTGEDFPYPIQGPCGFASIGGGVCCEVFCLGGIWGGPQECSPGVGGGYCYFTYETDVVESWKTTSSSSPGQTWEIVEVNTQSPSESYTPECSRLIATIIFDNYQLRINTGVQKAVNGEIIYNGGNCVEKPIQSCPSLRVILPNDSYGVNDYIDSNCNSCKPTNNIINIDNTPEFELITETRYAILGTLLQIGGLTPNVTFGMGCAEDPFHTQEYPDFERSCNETFPGVKIGGTAKSNWAYFLPYTMEASNNLEPPEKSECETEPVLSNMKQIGINSEDSNSETSQAKANAWRSNMEQLFATKSWCNNFYEFQLDDLIEGVIPGTCSLEFGGGSWPVYGVRSTRTLENGDWVYDSEVSSTSANISVAYIKYDYRRPVSVRDKFIEKFVEDVTPIQCSTFFGPAPKNLITGNQKPPPDNLKEIYKSTESKDSNCLSSPNCYDSTRSCAEKDLCCQSNYKPGK